MERVAKPTSSKKGDLIHLSADYSAVRQSKGGGLLLSSYTSAQDTAETLGAG